MIATAAWVCLLSPLAAALAIALAGRRLPRALAGYVATASTALSFAAAVWALVATLNRSESERSTVTSAFTWLGTHSYAFHLSLLIDPLSLVMMLVVSGVGTLIVGYSIAYMDREEEERRYFAYMAVFIFSMLLLVEGGNFFVLLAGWGMVGLSSYLLIGFWHERPSAIAAAKKAFIVNAIGDATMALALFLLIQHTGTLDFAGVFAQAETLGQNGWVINIIAAGLLGGALAKSAQIPLHTWLPDAMEGPTPVSALIHAATMVTAGVYLIVRAHPLIEQAPHVQQVAGGLGAATLLATGLIALVQTDIKRVIAYSTMSQIGYMFLAAGIGAYSAAIFHLMTHAFFKALLFLAAGIVIHALAGEQDMRKMGGLRKVLPKTYLAMLIGAGALAGLPPLAGFFSKDQILAVASSGSDYDKALLAAGLAGVVLTGLYAFRLVFLVFCGEQSAYTREHLELHGKKEGPAWMTSTVAVLALLTLVGGWIQIAGVWHPFATFLDPVAEPLVDASSGREWLISAVSVLLALAAIAVTRAIYVTRRLSAPRPLGALEQKLYFDRAYNLFFYRPAVSLTRLLGALVERPLIGGSEREIGAGTIGAGRLAAFIQNGLARSYALAISVGLSVILILFLVLR